MSWGMDAKSIADTPQGGLLDDVWDAADLQPDFSNTSSELDSPSHHDISLISGNHSLFEGGVGLVRHDRLLTDCQDLISSTGLPMTTVKSEVQEHSYSSVVGSDGDSIPDSPLSCTNETELDYHSGPMSISIKEEPMDSSSMLNELFSNGTGNLKEEPLETTTTTNIVFTNIRPKSVPIQRLMYPKVSLKVESAPSSNEECNNKEPGAPSLSFAKSRSPHHPNLTATVIRNSPKIIFGQHQQTSSSTSGTSQSSSRHPIQTALISSQPKGATGVLHLTEEEKRTLISEGYTVPQRLPLTKSEEKSLKKIRRKIKNKISAQESRRKKKEYMDTLEKRMQGINDELEAFKAKYASLEKQNSSLRNQLQQAQLNCKCIKKESVRFTVR